MYLLIFIAELIGLFIIASRMTGSLYLIFFLITRSRSVAITLLTLLLFPGTVLHELSHLFTAGILGVPAGKLELAPESIRSERIQMGSVSIAHTDPLRRYMIGLAPIFTGIIMLSALSYFFIPLWQQLTASIQVGLPLNISNLLLVILLFYLLVTISASMFSSKEDVSGLMAFVIAFGVIILILYVGGLRVDFSGTTLPPVMERIFSSFTRSIGIVLLTDLLLFLLFSLIVKAYQKIFRVRLG